MLARITDTNIVLLPFRSGTRNSGLFGGTRSSGLFGRVGRAVGDALTAASEARRRRQAVSGLNQLSDRELTDIGLSRADIPWVCAADRARQKAGRVAPNWPG